MRDRAALLAVVIGLLLVAGMVTVPELRAERRLQLLTGRAVPSALADGGDLSPVPAAIMATVDRRVVGAGVVRVEDLPAAELCDPDVIEWRQEPRVMHVVMTPTELVVDLEGAATLGTYDVGDAAHAPPAEARARCHATRAGGDWVLAPGNTALLRLGDQDVAASGGGGCCLPGGLESAFVDVAVPAGAVWALVERPGYWLALPADGRASVRVVRHFRPGAFDGLGAIRFVDAGGMLVDERDLG